VHPVGQLDGGDAVGQLVERTYRAQLRANIREFATETGSAWGAHLAENFDDYVGRFWLVKPKAADFDELLSRLRDTD